MSTKNIMVWVLVIVIALFGFTVMDIRNNYSEETIEATDVYDTYNEKLEELNDSLSNCVFSMIEYYEDNDEYWDEYYTAFGIAKSY